MISKRIHQMDLRRTRILDAAKRLVIEKGYNGLTMRSLAEASEVTVPTIYNLIGNKEEVVSTAILEKTISFWSSGTEPENPVITLEKTTGEMLRSPKYYRRILRLLFSGKAIEAQREVHRTATEQFCSGITAMDARGELESWVDQEMLAERLLSNYYGTAREWSNGFVSDQALPIVAKFDACLSLAGVSTPKAREVYQSLASKLQDEASRAAPPPNPKASRIG